MLENAVRICDAKFGNLLLYDGRVSHRCRMKSAPPHAKTAARTDPFIVPVHFISAASPRQSR